MSETQALVLLVGSLRLGADIADLVHVLPVEELARVPRAPRAVQGILQWKGDLAPVVNLRQRLGLPPTPFTGRERIVVAELQGQLVGMVVDAVGEIVPVAATDIGPVPPDPGLDAAFLIGLLRYRPASAPGQSREPGQNGEEAEQELLLIDLGHILDLAAFQG